VIGFAFAVNGQIKVADLYASPELFAAMWSKLLSASALEAVEHQKSSKVAAVPPVEVLAFLRDAEKGKQSMTVYKPIIPLANQAVEAAIKLAKGEKLETKPFHNDQNNTDVPSILLEVVVVEKSNLMDTVIKDGYAKYEDVYANVPEAERPKKP